MRRHTISYAPLFLCLILMMAGCAADPGDGVRYMEPVPVLDYAVPESAPNIVTDAPEYTPSSEKKAFLHIPEGEEAVEFFRIRDLGSDRLVYEGRFEETEEDRILRAEFSGFSAPGTYRIECDRYGCSEEFAIAEDVREAN